MKAYVKNILYLPYTTIANPKRIHEFFEQSHSIQSLKTVLNTHRDINGMVSLTLENLANIMGDLVPHDLEWESWDFLKFTEMLRLWTSRNLVDNFKREEPHKHQKCEKPDRPFQTQQKGSI